MLSSASEQLRWSLKRTNAKPRFLSVQSPRSGRLACSTLPNCSKQQTMSCSTSSSCRPPCNVPGPEVRRTAAPGLPDQTHNKNGLGGLRVSFNASEEAIEAFRCTGLNRGVNRKSNHHEKGDQEGVVARTSALSSHFSGSLCPGYRDFFPRFFLFPAWYTCKSLIVPLYGLWEKKNQV